MWLPTFQKRNEDLHSKMPAAHQKATQRHNNISNGLKREKFIQETLQRVTSGQFRSFRAATKVTGVSTLMWMM